MATITHLMLNKPQTKYTNHIIKIDCWVAVLTCILLRYFAVSILLGYFVLCILFGYFVLLGYFVLPVLQKMKDSANRVINGVICN